MYRSLSPGGPDQGSFVQSSSQHSNFDTHSLSRRSIKSRMSPMESTHAKVIYLDQFHLNKMLQIFKFLIYINFVIMYVFYNCIGMGKITTSSCLS